MRLNVIKSVTHISPSAFLMSRRCLQKFYLLRLAGYPYVERKQTKAAAIGTAFGAYMVDAIKTRREIMNDGPHLDLATNLSQITLPDVIDEAREIAKLYIKGGCLDIFLNANEVWLETERSKRLDNGVPILGILDGLIDGVPFDWKLRGFASTKKPSPTPGYRSNVKVTEDRTELNGPHKDQLKGLELTNVAWAVQMLFYNWLTASEEYIIHEVIPRDQGIQVSTLQGGFTPGFKKLTHEQLTDLWVNIRELTCDIPEPSISTFICEAYGTICEVADKCPPYMKTLGDEEYRKLYG